MLNFATIGTGFISEEFWNTACTNPEYRLYAVYSRDISKARSVADRFGAITIYDDIAAMSRDKNIDCVYIASPNSLHAAQSELFLRAGKHVLCEKPLCSNAAEVRCVTSCANEYGVFFAEAYKSAYMPGFIAVQSNLHKLGQIRSVFFSFAKYSSRYDAHKAGADVNTFKAEFSNGGMLDLGVYCLYPMLLLFGKPLGVKASAVKIPGGVDGAGFALLDYGSFDACVHYSKVSTSFLPCEIAGEDATMTVDRLNIPGRIEIKYRNGKTEDIEFDQRQDSMCYEIDAFISAVNEFKRAKHALLAFPLPMSLAAAEICDEIRRQTGISYPADAH